MKKCIIYVRFSPRKNAGESVSNETQAELCQEYAKRKGYEVAAICSDAGISGSEHNRPGLEKALKKLENGSVLLVYSRDRIARDLLLAELTRRRVAVSGATVEAVSGDIAGDDPQSVFIRQIMDAVAELERKQIAARTSAAMRTQQKNGKKMSFLPPYGYCVDKNDSKRLVFEPNERKAVERAVNLRRVGKKSGAEITRILNKEMPQFARAGQFNRKTVIAVLRREGVY